ncbi:probable Nitrate reductase [NADPH] [Pseudozyma flocculosa]|uniref:Nitrate reductase [NADPH] n=1 Tax=Pseudozyma flocculosa TaxID=84751 RepID=A0A5C3EXA2_9BASI|nr:probable Nitrate reductase [NADPH] [Pseudozyma flocculosa]
MQSSTPSSSASSIRGREFDASSSSSSSSTSHLTTPEPSSPILEPKDHAELVTVDPFAPRPVYDETVLPKIPQTEAVQPLAADANTPDGWIPRDERLIRLTGKHPFNTEPPLATLFNKGFLTPQNLFYVRSHGDTPRVTAHQAAEWKLRVHGLVENEFTFSIQDLKDKFATVTLPITLVCAGNRRKEQNMVAKGLGFNWGAAGVSTGLFTGVYLADVLEYCRPKNPLYSSFPSYDTPVPGRARHVVFEGADQLPKGNYGTSQRLHWCTDRSKGMLLAWGMNGEDLSPDHGYPLRLVVPGQIGGRMVKWLNRIEVSDRESQHHLHFFDNKLLPTEVSADQARNEDKWWYDPKYIINELNVNAAVCSPDHEEVVHLRESDDDAEQQASPPPPPQMLPIQGYAYTGGGRRITRVEVSLDDGKSWKLAEVDYPEDLYRMFPVQGHPYFGTLDLSQTEMSFSWCFWRLDVELRRQIIDDDVRVISVRAMDESLQTMPRDMYWNATSMMNSWWFRVAVHRSEDGKSVRFEHPTLAGNAPGGWMQRLNEAGASSRYPVFGDASTSAEAAGSVAGAKESTAAVAADGKAAKPALDIAALMTDPAKASRTVSAAEFAQHSDPEGAEPWFVVNGEVYEGTGFLKDHPGGDQSIRLVAGDDATEDFMAIHSIDAKKMMRDFHLGRLEALTADERTVDGLAKEEEAEEESSRPFLEPKRWKKTRLVSKTIVSPDSRIFRFALGHEAQRCGLPVGQHVFLRVKRRNPATGEIETIQRAYTPYSGDEQLGFLDILIKMTMALETIPLDGGAGDGEGDGEDPVTIELKGPLGSFTYLGDARIRWKPSDRVRTVRRLAMIAGGSGITPIWSTLKAIADEYLLAKTAGSAAALRPLDISLVYGNRTEVDILARTELQKLVDILDGRLTISHYLSNATDQWTGPRGRVDLAALEAHLPPAPRRTGEGEGEGEGEGDELEDTLALVCGPPPMEKAVRQSLAALGWDVERTVVFF